MADENTTPTEGAPEVKVVKPRAPRKTQQDAANKIAELEAKLAETNARLRAIEEEPVVIEEEIISEDSDGVDEIRALFDEADEELEPEPVVPPLSVRGVVLTPGYWQGFEGPGGRINVFAWLGAIFSVIFFPLGFIFSLLGLSNAKAVHDDTVGRIFGWVGLIISGFMAIAVFFWVLLLPFSAAFRLLTPFN